MTDVVETRPRAGNKRGPKFKLSDTDEMRSLMHSLGGLHPTTREVATFLKVSEPTLFDFWKRLPHMKEEFEYGKGAGCVSLRRSQMALARKNATMGIWLGKQLLGQKDHFEVTQNIQIDETIIVQVMVGDTVAKTVIDGKVVANDDPRLIEHSKVPKDEG